MPSISYQIVAATLTAGYDVFSAQPFLDFATAKFPRKVKRIGITGGAAIGDLICQLKYGPREVANGLFNNKTGVDIEHSMDMVYIVDTDTIAPDEPIILQITDAGNTNPYLFVIEIDTA